MHSHRIPRKEGFDSHYLEWNPSGTQGRLPVICVHGNLSNARMFQWIGELLSTALTPRRVIAIDIRGCGESGMPAEGFTLPHLASDIYAVMEHLGISKAHFLAYSRGVAYALQLAMLHPGTIHGLVIGDYPAYYTKLSEDWASRMTDSYAAYDSWDSLYEVLSASEPLTREDFEARKEQFYMQEEPGTIRKRYSKEFPSRLQQESADHDLSMALHHIQGQLLIVKGSEEGSLLNDEQLQVYENYNPSIVRVHGAGHDVFDLRQQVEEALLDYFKWVI